MKSIQLELTHEEEITLGLILEPAVKSMETLDRTNPHLPRALAVMDKLRHARSAERAEHRTV